jgi:hypothetical protein
MEIMPTLMFTLTLPKGWLLCHGCGEPIHLLGRPGFDGPKTEAWKFALCEYCGSIFAYQDKITRRLSKAEIDQITKTRTFAEMIECRQKILDQLWG